MKLTNKKLAKMKKSRRNPIARELIKKQYGNQIVSPKKGKGSYTRKGNKYDPFFIHEDGIYVSDIMNLNNWCDNDNNPEILLTHSFQQGNICT